jgi:hypothetical protein
VDAIACPAALLSTLKKTSWVLSAPRGGPARLGNNQSTLQFRMKLAIMRLSVSADASV